MKNRTQEVGLSKPRLGAPKRAGIGLLAGALAVFGVALAPSAGATTNVTTERLAGTTRYGTAAAISGDEAFAAPKTAIVATGENYPDALAASTLAGANAATPIILTQTNTYTTDAKSALAALKGKGVTNVTLVGGTAAVSDSVKSAIAADGFTVTRVAGTDRYATAASIATTANGTSPMTPVAGVKTALIATGLNFPDALAGGPAAYAYKMPLLLVSDTVPQATKDALTSLGIKNVEILGGTAAVSDAVKAQIDTITGGTSARLAGVNRYGTAAAVGDFEASTLSFATAAAILATGNNFPDALAAGPLGGQLQAPIVLTASLPSETQTWLQNHSSTIAKLYISGGTAVIDDATVAAAVKAAQGGTTSTNGVSSLPELQTATVQGTDASGTTVRYCFDEVVTAANDSLFHVWSPDGTQYDGADDQGVASNNKCVDVLFSDSGLQTATGAAGLTLATVDEGAAQDSSSNNNPIGSAGIGTAGTTALTPGRTLTPDLVSVGNFVKQSFSGSPGNLLATFTFDQNVYDADSDYSSLCLVPVASTNSLNCADSYISGEGTKDIVVEFNNDFGTWTTTTTARGVAYNDEFSADPNTNGLWNPLEAANVGGASDSPDLQSTSLNLSGKNALNQDTDQIIFNFDAAVTLNSATDFYGFTPNGEYDASDNYAAVQGVTGSVNPQNQNQVVINFPDGSLTRVVGAYVLDNAVTQFGGDGDGNNNFADEKPVTNSNNVTVTPGKTDGPDLILATVAATKDAFGNVTGAVVAYTFDENLVNGSTPTFGSFHAYDADGNEFTCTFGPNISNTAPSRQDTFPCATWDNGTGPGGQLTVTQAKSIVLATVDDNAVTSADGSPSNPEGAQHTSQFGFA